MRVGFQGTVRYGQNIAASGALAAEHELLVDQAWMEAPGNVVEVDETAAMRTGAADIGGGFEDVALVGQHQQKQQIEADQSGQSAFDQPTGRVAAGRYGGRLLGQGGATRFGGARFAGHQGQFGQGQQMDGHVVSFGTWDMAKMVIFSLHHRQGPVNGSEKRHR
ncbi:MAG TPA: hypothetical protein VLT88_00765 [Desulfosarcina sp.]|nr:hypothetical protein [Desulfosarcina sp.]